MSQHTARVHYCVIGDRQGHVIALCRNTRRPEAMKHRVNREQRSIRPEPSPVPRE